MSPIRFEVFKASKESYEPIQSAGDLLLIKMHGPEGKSYYIEVGWNYSFTFSEKVAQVAIWDNSSSLTPNNFIGRWSIEEEKTMQRLAK